jgi:hypothetical protein
MARSQNSGASPTETGPAEEVVRPAAKARRARGPVARRRAGNKNKADKEREQRALDRYTASITELRDVYSDRHILLRNEAQWRTKKQRILQFVSGFIALGSGGAISAAIADFLPIYTKIVGAVLAFTSATVSLVSSHFLDSKETHKMFEGAAHYAVIADRASSLLDGRDMTTAKQLLKDLNRLRNDGSKLSTEYGSLLPGETSKPPSAAPSTPLPPPASS